MRWKVTNVTGQVINDYVMTEKKCHRTKPLIKRSMTPADKLHLNQVGQWYLLNYIKQSEQIIYNQYRSSRIFGYINLWIDRYRTHRQCPEPERSVFVCIYMFTYMHITKELQLCNISLHPNNTETKTLNIFAGGFYILKGRIRIWRTRYRTKDPDPNQHVSEPEHCLKGLQTLP